MRALVEKLALSLTHRNAIKVFLVMIALHLVISLLYFNENRLARRVESREAVIQKIVNVINLIYATPVEDRSKAIAAMTDPYLGASISAVPQYPLQFKTIQYWQISQSLRHQLGLFAVSIQLESTQWLNIHATIYSHFLVKQLIYLGIEVFLFIVIISALWAVTKFTQPFLSFAEMAEQLAANPNSHLLPVDGPEVVKDASLAMQRMQARIGQLIADRTLMLAAISHDLKTPLTRISLRLQCLEDQQVAEKMARDLSEMEAMINESLAFARDDGSREQNKPLDLVSLIESICLDLNDQGYAVHFRTHKKRVGFSGKPLALKRAFSNVIGNATRYANRVTVLVTECAKTIVIQVKDNGPGMPPSELEKVFAPFYRVEQSRNRNTGGFGLGLAVTKEIIKLHGGDIQLSNLEPHGLCVTITLGRNVRK